MNKKLLLPIILLFILLLSASLTQAKEKTYNCQELIDLLNPPPGKDPCSLRTELANTIGIRENTIQIVPTNVKQGIIDLIFLRTETNHVQVRIDYNKNAALLLFSETKIEKKKTETKYAYYDLSNIKWSEQAWEEKDIDILLTQQAQPLTQDFTYMADIISTTLQNEEVRQKLTTFITQFYNIVSNDYDQLEIEYDEYMSATKNLLKTGTSDYYYNYYQKNKDYYKKETTAFNNLIAKIQDTNINKVINQVTRQIQSLNGQPINSNTVIPFTVKLKYVCADYDQHNHNEYLGLNKPYIREIIEAEANIEYQVLTDQLIIKENQIDDIEPVCNEIKKYKDATIRPLSQQESDERKYAYIEHLKLIQDLLPESSNQYFSIEEDKARRLAFFEEFNKQTLEIQNNFKEEYIPQEYTSLLQDINRTFTNGKKLQPILFNLDYYHQNISALAIDESSYTQLGQYKYFQETTSTENAQSNIYTNEKVNKITKKTITAILNKEISTIKQFLINNKFITTLTANEKEFYKETYKIKNKNSQTLLDIKGNKNNQLNYNDKSHSTSMIAGATQIEIIPDEYEFSIKEEEETENIALIIDNRNHVTLSPELKEQRDRAIRTLANTLPTNKAYYPVLYFGNTDMTIRSYTRPTTIGRSPPTTIIGDNEHLYQAIERTLQDISTNENPGETKVIVLTISHKLSTKTETPNLLIEAAREQELEAYHSLNKGIHLAEEQEAEFYFIEYGNNNQEYERLHQALRAKNIPIHVYPYETIQVSSTPGIIDIMSVIKQTGKDTHQTKLQLQSKPKTVLFQNKEGNTIEEKKFNSEYPKTKALENTVLAKTTDRLLYNKEKDEFIGSIELKLPNNQNNNNLQLIREDEFELIQAKIHSTPATIPTPQITTDSAKEKKFNITIIIDDQFPFENILTELDVVQQVSTETVTTTLKQHSLELNNAMKEFLTHPSINNIRIATLSKGVIKEYDDTRDINEVLESNNYHHEIETPDLSVLQTIYEKTLQSRIPETEEETTNNIDENTIIETTITETTGIDTKLLKQSYELLKATRAEEPVTSELIIFISQNNNFKESSITTTNYLDYINFFSEEKIPFIVLNTHLPKKITTPTTDHRTANIIFLKRIAEATGGFYQKISSSLSDISNTNEFNMESNYISEKVKQYNLEDLHNAFDRVSAIYFENRIQIPDLQAYSATLYFKNKDTQTIYEVEVDLEIQ